MDRSRARRWTDLVVRSSGWMTLLCVLVYFALTVLPLRGVDPFARSRFEPLPQGGIRLPAPSLFISAPSIPALSAEGYREGRFVVELAVRTERGDVVGPARILALTDGPAHQNWLVGQEGDALAIRHRGREASFAHTLGPDETQLWQILFEGERVTLLGRGGYRETRKLVGRILPWEQDCRLTLANELTGDRPWGGEILALSLHETDHPSDRLDLVTAEGGLRFLGRHGESIDLEPVSWPWELKLRRSLDTALRVDPFDVTQNVLMTLPYGFFFAIFFRRWRPINVLGLLLATQFIVTLSAEFLQLFSLDRYPTPSDFVANAVGALAGLVVARRVLRQQTE